MSNDPRRPRRPKQGGDPVTDIERFLKEVDRLRRKTSDDTPRSDQSVEEVRPVEPPRRRRPEPRPVARPKPRPRLEEEPVPVLEVQPIERPAIREDAAVFAPPPAAPAYAQPEMVEQVMFKGAAATKPEAPSMDRRSAVEMDIRTLLQGSNIRTAIILREILDRPRCMRPYRMY